jgi:tyrosine-protein kinase Etk/Wzc
MATDLLTENLRDNKMPRPAVSGGANGEISFAELFATIYARKRTLLWAVSAAAFVSAAIAFLMPAEYTAEAVILTPQQAQPSLSAMAQLAGAGAGLSGLSLLSGFGLRNPSDLYVGILESRTIADALITRFDLLHVYGDKYVQRARKHLARRTSIKAGKDTLIHIQVEDRNPKRAAQLANAYVEELSSRNATVALTEASQRRLFFEEQVAKEKALLASAEIALRDTQQSTGLVVPSGQAEALIRSASQLNAEILSREAQLAGMRTIITDDNPRFQMVKHELGALRSELAKLESGEHVGGTPEVPVGKLPQAGLEYLRKYRDVKYHEGLFEALAKQYEAARLDEAKAAPLVQVIDKAVIPERKSWPPRLLIVFISSVLVAFGSCLWIMISSQTASQAKA